MRLRKRPAARTAGFSLVEIGMAMGVMGILSYAFISASDMGNSSYQAVAASAAEGRDMRAARTSIASEFRTTDESTVDIVVLADGNHQVTLQQPLVIAGAMSWGAHDPSWGPTEADQNQVGWQVRYMVAQAPVNGVNQRQLWRQVLDGAGALQEQDMVISGLRSGLVDPPGFQVAQIGDVWEIQVTTEGYRDDSEGRGAEFHVRIRN